MKKVLKELKPYYLLIALSTLFIFVQVILNLYLPNLMSDIINNGIVGQSMDNVWGYGKDMLIVTLIAMVFTISASFIAAKVSSGFARRLRKSVYEKVQTFSLEEYNKISTSSLITRTTNDVTQVQNLTLMAMRMMVQAPLMCIGGIIMAVSKNVQLSFVFLVIIPLLLLLIGLVAKKVVPMFTKLQNFTDRLNQVVREKLTGVRVIRAFGTQKYEANRYDTASKDIYEVNLKVSYIISILMPLIFFVINISSVIIIWFGAGLIDAGSLQIGDMMAFMQYAIQVLFSILMLTMMFVMIPRAIVSARRINEVLEIEPVIIDNGKEISKEEILNPGEIEFENVEFKYKESDEPVLMDLNFKITKGQTVAIIGSTGAGKTTILNLMLRFYDATKGNIKVGGINVKDMSLESLRAMIGFVPQKVNLFSGTIAENIKYGKQDATEEEIIEASKIAQSYEFIESQENGYESVVSQGGTNFSGGQKQRISIARALVKKADIYLFDDSFSALDYNTDKKLREALKNDVKGSTVIIVAQRVSTILKADNIIFIDEGKILAQGTHKELYKNCEEYREIVLSQISKEEAMLNE